jgi:multiple sugar transport system substrate-binding protein
MSEKKEETKVSRRSYMKYGAAAVVVVAAGAGGAYYYSTMPSPTPPPTATATTSMAVPTTTVAPVTTVPTTVAPATTAAENIVFTMWQYNVAEVKDNISKFQTANPNITVTEYDDPWPDWPAVMIKRFTSATPVDVTYDGEDWLAQWAAAGWVVPLEDYWDKYTTNLPFKTYLDDMSPYAKSSMIYNGKVYGLPYYSDMFTFMYNAKMLSDNGLDVPTDWNEVQDVAVKLKQKGVVTYPFQLQMQANNPFDFYVILSAAYGDGAKLFDENYNPLFNDPSSPFYQYLQWLVDGLHKYYTISPDYLQNHETVVVQRLGAGQGAMTVLAKYNLAAANAPKSSPLAGDFRMALMPGKTHQAYGFAKMYNITKTLVDRGDAATQAAITFTEYFGGNGPAPKRWAVQDGLGFGYLSLYNDPDVAAAINTLYGQGATDIIKQQSGLAISEGHPVWFGQWCEYCFSTAIPAALSQQKSVADAIKDMADNLNKVKSG